MPDVNDDRPPPRPLEVACPTCGHPSVYGAANPWRPFCSERCRRIDLGAWASERWRIESPIAPEDDGAGHAD